MNSQTKEFPASPFTQLQLVSESSIYLSTLQCSLPLLNPTIQILVGKPHGDHQTNRKRSHYEQNLEPIMVVWFVTRLEYV